MVSITRKRWADFDRDWAWATGHSAINDWQIGRCRKEMNGCNRLYAWARGHVKLADAYCPDCGHKLYQTTLLVGNGRAYFHFLPVGEVGRLQEKVQAPGVEKKVIDDLMDGRVLKALHHDHEREGMTINEVNSITHLGFEKIYGMLDRLVRAGWVKRHIGTTVRYANRDGIRFAVPKREGTTYYTLARQLFPQEGGRS